MEIKDQTSRTAVVTGGGSGIGAAVCHHLAAAGHRVAVLDLDREAADACARAIRGAGREAFATAVDVASRESIDGALDEVRQMLGPIDILVTSAAVSGFAPLEQIDAPRWERTIAINLTGTFHSVQAAIGDMVDGGWGRIVTIASAAGQAGSARQTDYAASKGGVIALTKTVALEFASRGVTCNTLAPFAADTPLLRAQQAANLLPGDEIVHRMIPVGRMATPDDLAATCAFLCTEEAAYLTGQVVAVNGGALT